MRCARELLALLLAVSLAVLWATPASAYGAQDESDLEVLRERWWNKSEEERRLLRERYELLQRLPAQRRVALVERREIDGLGPEASRARWREITRLRGVQLGRQRLDRLPERLRWRLQYAPPADHSPSDQHRYRREEGGAEAPPSFRLLSLRLA